MLIILIMIGIGVFMLKDGANKKEVNSFTIGVITVLAGTIIALIQLVCFL